MLAANGSSAPTSGSGSVQQPTADAHGLPGTSSGGPAPVSGVNSAVQAVQDAPRGVPTAHAAPNHEPPASQVSGKSVLQEGSPGAVQVPQKGQTLASPGSVGEKKSGNISTAGSTVPSKGAGTASGDASGKKSLEDRVKAEFARLMAEGGRSANQAAVLALKLAREQSEKA
jgi:hypothetical protein